MSARSILIALVIVGAATQASATPPPPAAPPTNPIELVVVLADGERRVATLDERQVRVALGRNIFYSIDAFIEAGLDALGLAHEIACDRSGDIPECRVVMIDGLASSSTHHWQLTRDGRAEMQSINRIMWSGVRSLQFNYQAKSPSP